jgi:hydrogenase expression/formation protein HypC
MSAPACEPGGHCVTCSDEGIPMQVAELREDGAVCVDEQGERHDVAVDLLGPVAPGDQVLVHAGVAIA